MDQDYETLKARYSELLKIAHQQHQFITKVEALSLQLRDIGGYSPTQQLAIFNQWRQYHPEAQL